MSRAIHFGEDITLKLYDPGEASNGISRVWRMSVTGIRDPGDGEWSAKISRETLCGRVNYWLVSRVEVDCNVVDKEWPEAQKAIVTFYEEYTARNSLLG